MKKETINEFGERVITMTLEDITPLSDEDRDMIRKAAQKPITYDEDCPPMSEEMLERFEKDIEERRKTRMASQATAATV